MSVTVELEPFTDLLGPCPTDKRWFRDKLEAMLRDRTAIPAFSASTVKLLHATQDPDTSMDELEEIISMDPGLGTQCIRAVNTVEFGGRRITSVGEALQMLGLRRIGQLAVTAGVMDRFSHLRVEVDWNRFWLHNLLVARICHTIAGAFRSTNGSEYLAGLLHDSGKLVLQHFFPREFEDVVVQAGEREQPHHVVEQAMLGVSHAHIGSAMAMVLGIDECVIQAVRFHHEPLCEASINAAQSGDGFLATCVAVANAVAKQMDGAFASNEDIPPLHELPEWGYLGEFERCGDLRLDPVSEHEKAVLDLESMLGG